MKKLPASRGLATKMTMNSIKYLSAGIKGMDEVLKGGFEANNSYLVRGNAGTGKTILGFHFLAAGIANNEQVLFISIQETEQKIRTHAQRIGMDLSLVNVLDLSPPLEFFSQTTAYDIFTPAEVERKPVANAISKAIERIQPSRIVVDSISQFRLLSIDQFHFRKQVLAFIKLVSSRNATVLLTSEFISNQGDEDLQTMVDGIIQLEHYHSDRSVTVQKMRGNDFLEGKHSLRICGNGLIVYPNTFPVFRRPYTKEQISSGIPEIDTLLNGGIERGTVTMISGPSGIGKTTLGMQFMKEAASRGERSIIISFDEDPEMILNRCENLSIPAHAIIESGMLALYKIDPRNLLCDELGYRIRHEVEDLHTNLIMLDSITTYAHCLPNSAMLWKKIESIRMYLSGSGTGLFLISEISDSIEYTRVSEYNLNNFADNIILMQYMESHGELRKSIGVLKKRLSDFEKSLREFELTKYGIKVSNPLTGFRGILRGIPDTLQSG